MKTPKINPESMRKAFDNMHDTFVRKNTDYGNSFENSLDNFGILAGIVRMSDKWERLLSLTNSKEGPLVVSESVSDTLMDLANYATMLSVYLQDHVVENSDETIFYSRNEEVYRISDGKITFPVKKPQFGEELPTKQRMVADAIDKFMKIADFDMSLINRELDIDSNLNSVVQSEGHLNVNYRSHHFTVWGKDFRVNKEVISDTNSVYTVGFGDDDNGWDYLYAKDAVLDGLLDSYCDMLDSYMDLEPKGRDFKMACVRWLNRINYEKYKRNETIEYIFNSKFERVGNPLIYVSLVDIAMYIAKYLSEHEEILGGTINSLVLEIRTGLYLTNNNDAIMLLVLNELITSGKMGKNTVKKYDFIPQEDRFVRLEDIESTLFRSDVAHYLTENTVYQGENLYFRDKNS